MNRWPLVRAGRTRVLLTAGVTAVALIAVAVARQPTSLVARTAEPTFARDVAPIVYKNCTTCHRPGGMAPFSLLDYDSAVAEVNKIDDPSRIKPGVVLSLPPLP